jgi:phage shock protein C
MNDITGNSGGTPPSRSFRLDKMNGKVFGVCSGIGNYFGIDPMLARLGFVLATLLGVGAPVLIYIAIALIAD